MATEESPSAFWEQASQAGDPGQVGYLAGEWPPALAENRFRGELAEVNAWLDRHLAGRRACLDIGCGAGLWLEQFAKRFERADGIDLAAGMVAHATARLAQRGVQNARIWQSSLGALRCEGRRLGGWLPSGCSQRFVPSG